MNILQISTTDNKGGAAGIAWSIKKYLDEKGIENSMFVRDKYSNDPKVFRLPNKFPKLSKIFKYILSNDLEYSNSDWILQTEEYKKADIVHCHNLHGYYFDLETLYKISLEKKIIWTFHDMWPITSHCAYTFENYKTEKGFFACSSNKIYPLILFKNDKKLMKKKTDIYNKTNFHIVGPSKWILNCVEKTKLKDKPRALIYNGVDQTKFKKYDKMESRKELDLPPDKKIVLFIAGGGKKNPFKGSKYFNKLDSLYKKDSKVVFLNVGSNINKRHVKGNVLYIPKVKNKDLLAKIYSASDVLLNPTLADNLPTVILEAYSCGLPAISFDTGGVSEIISHFVDGFVSEYENLSDLKKNLDKILNLSTEKYNKLSENAIIKSSKFDQEKMSRSYLELYNELL